MILVPLVVAWTTMTHAPPRQPTFRARTVVTELEVHVTDASGRPVTDLTRDDFEVAEDGVAQVLIGGEALGRAPDVTAASAATPAQDAAGVAQPGTTVRATNRRNSDTRAWRSAWTFFLRPSSFGPPRPFRRRRVQPSAFEARRSRVFFPP